MNKIRIKKETTIQAYGEFWDAFLFLKMKQEEKGKGWSKIKLSAITMACFSIEAFANHVGQQLYSDWETCGKWNSPIDKLKKFIKRLGVDIKLGEPPFQTIDKIMGWRNKVAHAETKIFVSEHKVARENYDELLGVIRKTEWQEFYLSADLNKIEKDCKEVMEIIHRKAFKHLEWFLGGARHSTTTYYYDEK